MLNQPTTVDHDHMVKPHQKLLIPNYYIWYWLRELGPALAWLILAVQQLCWRAQGKAQAIPQALLAQEIGLTRQTVISLLQNPLSGWHLVMTAPAVAASSYYPQANRYVPLDLPLTPAHQAGLYGYFQQADPTNASTALAAVEALLALPARQALAVIEAYPGVAEARERPQSINEIMASTTGLKVKGQLAEKCSDLQTHLTSLGFTACHQYFRRMWVPKLGPALAWLIMVLRSRCFYRAETDELRDQATWRKGELAACLGQTTRNLSNLLTHADAELFFKILSQNKPSLTLKVEMVSEPLLADPATAVNEPIPVPINPKKDDNLSLPVAQKSDTTALEPKKVDSYHPEVENFLPPDPADRKKADPTKYLSNQPIPNQKIIPSLPIQLFNLSNGGNCHETK